jgi:hypothetical protein
VALRRDPSTGALVRVCPHCHGASRTLATRCPLCGRLFDEEDSSFIDELPFVEFDSLLGNSSAGAMFGLVAAALCNAVILVVLGPFVLLRRGVRRALRARRGRD